MMRIAATAFFIVLAASLLWQAYSAWKPILTFGDRFSFMLAEGYLALRAVEWACSPWIDDPVSE